MTTRRHNFFWTILIALFLLLQLSGCDRHAEPEAAHASSYFKEIKEYRAWKDMSFKENPNSPIKDSDRASFRGLKYFAINPELKFTVKLEHFEQPDTIAFMTNSGKKRPALRYGYFDLSFEAGPERLIVYKMLDLQQAGDTHFFVPFGDATSGTETYGGGRYLDFEENETGIYEVDFNLAYNPSCAYGKKGYVCPLPPDENLLDVAIRAGEKKWH